MKIVNEITTSRKEPDMTVIKQLMKESVVSVGKEYVIRNLTENDRFSFFDTLMEVSLYSADLWNRRHTGYCLEGYYDFWFFSDILSWKEVWSYIRGRLYAEPYERIAWRLVFMFLQIIKTMELEQKWYWYICIYVKNMIEPWKPYSNNNQAVLCI